MSNISKVAKTKMEVTAEYQKLSDLNVAFYNQDINTSILQFNVTRNDGPVPLGKSNVDGYIVLLHEDGSRIQDNLEIVDEIKGIIQYTIPKEFLKHTGKVLGQVYIAVKGCDDTAVMRKISFDIKQDLLTGFSSTKKLEYIKTFDDLQTQIKQRVAAIEEAIANGADYVTAMGKAAEKGRKDIQAVAAKATTDVNKAATDATKKITDTSNTAVTTVTGKAKEVTDAITNNQVVKIKDVVDYQKKKITADDGSTITIKNYDLLNTTDVSNFDGYSNTTINMPAGVHKAGYIKRKIREGFIEVTYSPYNLNTVYRNSYNPETKVWTGWVQFANQTDVTALKGSDTGWVTYTTINGVLANTAFKDSGDNGYNCAYRKTTANGITRLLLRVNISEITAETVIFSNLPKGIVVNSQTGVARTNGADQKTVVTLRPSGDLIINVPSGFTVKAYVYHQFEWTL